MPRNLYNTLCPPAVDQNRHSNNNEQVLLLKKTPNASKSELHINMSNLKLQKAKAGTQCWDCIDLDIEVILPLLISRIYLGESLRL